MQSKPVELSEFRNIHCGGKIVVCGCGVSLKEFDAPERFITIGVNDVGRLFQPTYLVVVNPRHQFAGDRFQFVERSKARYLFSQLSWSGTVPPLVKFRLGRYGGTTFTDPNVLHYTRNSPYVALGLAVQMGAKRIGLIGVDFTAHHFFRSTGAHPLSRQLNAIDAEYRRLGKALAASGIEVFNLSQQSRLTAFPKLSWEAFSQEPPASREEATRTFVETEQPVVTCSPGSPSASMTIAIEKYKPGIIGDFFDSMASTAQRLGHLVNRQPRWSTSRTPGVAIVWNGRRYRNSGRFIYCEHGWLPRWAYQVSPKGINADSHIAPFAWDGCPLTGAQRQSLEAHLSALRKEAPAGSSYMRPDLEGACGLPEAFILAPLQMPGDTNIQRHVPVGFKSMQKWVDAISEWNPPFPVLFKQHPADLRRGNQQLRLRLRRSQDRLMNHASANVHQILKTRRCRLIVALNSNVVHDGLIWDVPAIVLGRNVWPERPPSPFLLHLPKEWVEVERFFVREQTVLCREAYAFHLMRNQWTLADARSEQKVEQLLAAVGANPQRRPSKSKPPLLVDVPASKFVNVVATNRGWFFEDLKRHFVAASTPELPVVASEQPRRDAAAWIVIRTREARGTPDANRTLVQIHDLDGADGSYAPGGERAAVARCAATVLTHPDQRDILERAGISLIGKQVLCKPIGALRIFQLRQKLSARFTIAWVGRPVMHHGVELKRIRWFITVLRQLGLPRGAFEVTLLGDRLDAYCRELVQAGVICRYLPRQLNPIEKYPQHYQTFDCMVITSAESAGPNCLFEALASGVPVLSTKVGWASRLVQPGKTGVLFENVPDLKEALQQFYYDRKIWFERRELCRQAIEGLSLESWVAANLEVARSLAGVRTQPAL